MPSGLRPIIRSTTDYASSSLDPLSQDVRHGMIAIGIFGLLSSVSTFSLFIFITYRMIKWRKYYNYPIASNQTFMLIYNLLLADFQQALGFLFAFHWVSEDRLVGPTPACFAQGFLIHIGDVSSGVWVLLIGVHTFVTLILQKTIPMSAFIICVISLWIFCLILTIVGPITNRNDFFVPAGSWCWINEKYEKERLYLHYIWIFIAEIGSIALYTSLFIVLRKNLSGFSLQHGSDGLGSSNNETENKSFNKPGTINTTTVITTSVSDPFLVSRQRIAKSARYMVVYPFAYVALTLPLAAGRVAAMAGKSPPLSYLAVAGVLMSSCGIVDVVLYITTRKALIRTNVGVKSSRKVGNGLTKVETAGSRRQKSRDTINMEDLNTPSVPASGIVVSKSVTRSENSFATHGEPHSSMERSDSLRSLVNKQELGMRRNY